eukprot:963819-Pelagomonas_calceolata.AAC.1
MRAQVKSRCKAGHICQASNAVVIAEPALSMICRDINECATQGTTGMQVQQLLGQLSLWRARAQTKA